MDSAKVVKRLQKVLKKDFADWVRPGENDGFFRDEPLETLGKYAEYAEDNTFLCLCDMAEYHVVESDDYVPDAVNEFDDTDAQLFPYEILAYLRLREWNGLKNPDRFDHPLMNQPLAWLPEPVPLAQPETPLLDRVIERFRTEYPELPPTR